MDNKARGSYKCGRCGDNGHNARTCTNKFQPSLDQRIDEETAVLNKILQPRPPIKKDTTSVGQVPLSTTQDLTYRPVEDVKTLSRPPSPYDCPTCKRVGILVLVELEDSTPQLRCEHCHNQVRCKVILKWGAAPLDKPAAGTPNPSRMIIY